MVVSINNCQEGSTRITTHRKLQRALDGLGNNEKECALNIGVLGSRILGDHSQQRLVLVPKLCSIHRLLHNIAFGESYRQFNLNDKITKDKQK
jgi:hypothetical protein